MKPRNLVPLWVCAGVLLATAPTIGAEEPEEVFETPTTKAVPTKMPAPEFPEDLLDEGVEGIVVLVAIIDEAGNVVAVEIKKASHEEFGRAAATAVRRWKFKPALKDGRPIRSKFTIPLKFDPADY